jgi:azurin
MNLFPALCVMSALAFGQATTTTSTATTTAKPAAKAAAKAGGKAGRTIEITSGDNMKFDVTEITAKPGESLKVVLKNTGTMPKIAMAHNFVLLKPGTDAAEFNKAAFNARETDFIPPAMKDAVLASTALAGAGEVVETTFKAPTKPGTYTFVCSFPGHFALGMRGTLTVK